MITAYLGGDMRSNESESPLVSRDEARQYLRVSLATMDRLIAHEVLPVIRVGRRVLLRRDDLDEFIKEQRWPTGVGGER